MYQFVLRVNTHSNLVIVKKPKTKKQFPHFSFLKSVTSNYSQTSIFSVWEIDNPHETYRVIMYKYTTLGLGFLKNGNMYMYK